MGKWYGQPGAKENALEIARLVMDSVQHRLEAFEIGNEPDIFILAGHRPDNYTLAQYISEWNEYADAASEQILKGNKYGLDETRFFQGCVFSDLNQTWTV